MPARGGENMPRSEEEEVTGDSSKLLITISIVVLFGK
jgi:hypothetical protein